MGPLLSIIVPVYKTERYLSDCIDSIIEQDYRDLELILIDDGSPDDCGKICDRYAGMDRRIKVIHQDNGGVAVARNAGLDLAKGEYITFVDSDDCLVPGILKKLMEAHPFEMLVFGCIRKEIATGETCMLLPPTDKELIDWSHDGGVIGRMYRESLLGYVCCKIYNRSVLEGVRFRRIMLREDMLFNIEASCRVPQIRISHLAGYCYQIHPDSTLRCTYRGPVPDISGTAKLFRTVHPDLDPTIGRNISNVIIKTYILDALRKYVFLNRSLTDDQRRSQLRTVIRDPELRAHLRTFPEDGGLFRLLTLSYKLRSCVPLYHILKRMWKL